MNFIKYFWIKPFTLKIIAGILIFLFWTLVSGFFMDTKMGAIPKTNGEPLGCDFVSLWSAAKAVFSGQIDTIWNISDGLKRIAQNFPPDQGFFKGVLLMFSYPPSFLLVIAPLGLIPYGYAFLIWSIIGAILFICGVLYWLKPFRLKIIDKSLFILSSPSLFYSLFTGQNGTLTSGLWMWGAKNPATYSRSCGIALGLLALKPQMFIVVLPVLIAGRYWNALKWCLVSAIIPVVASLMIWGDAPWVHFLHNISEVKQQYLMNGKPPLNAMVSLYAFLNTHGVSYLPAITIHSIVALIVMSVLLYKAYQRKNEDSIGMLMIASTPFISPYMFDYDLSMFMIPILWMSSDKNNQIGGKAYLLAFLYFSILLIRPFQVKLGIPVGLCVDIVMYIMVLKYFVKCER